MPVITVLPSAVADQIAAGEVVERPASVVKELVENALDAGATAISLAIEDGGRTLIRVSDDGCGMDADDAVLCLARHGTSKIRSSADLAAVHTFGFRGEALPAIASVSRLELETARSDGAGTRVVSAGGAPAVATPTQRRCGTTVSVANLFFNVPARAKFLRGARSEWRAISDALVTLALVRRDIRLDVTHDGRRAFAASPAATLRARIAELWRAEYANSLLAVDDVSGVIHVSGLVERPADVGTRTRRTFIAVNGRAIRDAGIVRAAEAAFRSTIPAGTRPSLFLDVTLPAGDVDVNVHPAKAEVRFQDRWTVERAVERAVRAALGNFDAGAGFGRTFFVTSELGAPVQVDRDVLQPIDAPPLFATAADAHAAQAQIAPYDAPPSHADPTPSAHPAATEAIPALTQLRRTYIMFEHEDGVVLIDQHSAHERVLYETFLGQFERGDAPSQRLLLPLTIDLAPAELDALERHRVDFERVGYEVAPFGGSTVAVYAVPAPHRRFDAERCLRDTLASLTGDRVASTAARHEKMLATMACKAAVKAGDSLSDDEMRALFIALRDTRLPAHDVHGRATIVQLAWSEVERRFGRA